MSSLQEGILFISTGSRYLHEAIESAVASRIYLDGRPIAIVTDDVNNAHASGAFDLVLSHPNPRHSYRDKIEPLIALPFDKTLFLDSDARPIRDVKSMFRILDYSHFAAAHAPVRLPSGWQDLSVPDLFPEFNSGVLLLKRSKQQRKLISQWLDLYDKIDQAWDQASLRSVLWQEQQRGLKITVLPPEANLRLPKPWIAGKGLEVSIVHGRIPSKDWSKLIAYLNNNPNQFRTSEEWNQLRTEASPDPIW